MKWLKHLSNTVQWTNILTLAAQAINILPAGIQGNKYVMIAQGILGVILPSVNGVGHKIVFGTPQDADK